MGHPLTEGKHPSPDILRRLIPIGQLAPECQHEVRMNTFVRALPPGASLFLAGSAMRRLFYLLEGSVEVTDPKGHTITVVGGSEAGLQPLRSGPLESCRATAKTHVRFIRVEEDWLKILEGRRRADDVHLEEIGPDDASLDNRVLHTVYHAYLEDRLQVPSVPDVAQRIRRAMTDPDIGVDSIARIIQADPPLAAELIGVANSAFYGPHSSATGIDSAIVRLRLSVTRDLVTSLSLRRLYRARHPLVRRRLTSLWRQGCKVGALALVIARETRVVEAERGLLAGLVHNVGTLVILSHAEAHPECLSDGTLLEETIHRLTPQVSAMVLRKWDLGEDLVSAALESGDWTRDEARKADLCDVVLLARLKCPNRQTHAELPSWETVPAFLKLSASLGAEEFTRRVLDEAQAELDELSAALSA